MKDYTLLPIYKNNDAWINWTKTYLRELNDKVFSLFNYNNFFIPDFLKKDNISTYKQLEYHNWHRVTEAEANNEDFLNAKAGFAIVSYARNENQIDTENGEEESIRQNSEYYISVPSSWAGFYNLYMKDNVFICEYNRYAEEEEGRNSLIYNIDLFPSRFFCTKTDTKWPIVNRSTGCSIYARPLGEENAHIIDLQEHYWTDMQGNPIMVFSMLDDEEIILDGIAEYTKMADTNIACYNITRRNNTIAFAPDDCYFVLI